MKLPNIKTISFYQYLNIKKIFLKKSIKFLEDLKKGHWTKHREEGFDNKMEVIDMLNYQKEQLKEANDLIDWEKRRIFKSKPKVKRLRKKTKLRGEK